VGERTPPCEDDSAAVQFDALQLIVVDDESRDCALDDADTTGGQVLALLGGKGVGVREQRDVGRPLPNQQRVLNGLGGASQHAEGLVADLIAMAIRAVQQVLAPSLPDPGNVR
jgi:hypothetical protein